MTSWSFLTNHRRTLLCTARHGRSRIRGSRVAASSTRAWPVSSIQFSAHARL